MQPLTPRNNASQRAASYKYDPAPSRIGFRIQRLWLTPFFRILVSRGIPGFLVAFFLYAFVTKPENMNAVQSSMASAQSQLAQRPEYQLQSLAISGASPALTQEVTDALALEFPISTLNLDLNGFVQNLNAIAGVRTAQVTYDDSRQLVVVIEEHKPAAVLKTDQGELVLVSREGTVLRSVQTNANVTHLPVVTGLGAQDHIPQALNLFAEVGQFDSALRGLVRVGERRWDLVFADDLVVSLSASHPKAGVHQLAILAQNMRLFDGRIARVDFRNNRRPTLRLRKSDVNSVQAASGLAVWGLN